MNITLSHQQRFCLAERFAEVIHAQVVDMHLRVSDGIWTAAWKQDWPKRTTEFLEVRAAIASVTDGLDRRCFIDNIKFHLNRRFESSGTHRGWQDYLAAVRRAHQKEMEVAT